MMKNKSTSAAWVAAGIAGLGALASTALYNAARARKAERETPPIGKFIEVDGVRLHYVDHGEGRPLVLLHGNGATLQDFILSGIVDAAASRFRVIAFDRPGFGYSERPRTTIWSPAAQAKLILTALRALDAHQPIVLGHSWGTLPALAMALDNPDDIAALVLASGFYFPEPRVDAVLAGAPAIPILGDIQRYTISPLAGRAMAPHIFKTIFAPREVPDTMTSWPVGLALRPSQIRAAAADSALMLPAVIGLGKRYGDLRVPISIIGGEGDQLVDFSRHSRALHERLPGSTLLAVPGAGHMVHYAIPEAVVEAADHAGGLAEPACQAAVAEEVVPPPGAAAF